MASRPPPLRLLFLGNSYTHVNDLPGRIAALAVVGGFPRPVTHSETPGGMTLRQHAARAATWAAIADGPWDHVVLQEQSQVPSFPAAERARVFDPAVRALVAGIRSQGATPLLFATWGYRDGDRRNWPGDTYEAMQARLDAGYGAIARELDVPVAWVGAAWQAARARQPDLALWAPDGSHPAPAGTDLAAAVFAARWFDLNPPEGAEPRP